MPEGLLLPPMNQKIKIGPGLSTFINPMKATVGTIIASSVIEIQDVFGPGSDKRMIPGEKIEFYVYGVRNQRSSKDAGGMKITTFTKINGDFYVVDNGETKSSFIAEAGKIVQTDLNEFPFYTEVDKIVPTDLTESLIINFGNNNTWRLIFSAEHTIPASGYIKVMAPKEVSFSDLTFSSGSCKKWSCPKEGANRDTIVFRVHNEITAGQEIAIDLAGI